VRQLNLQWEGRPLEIELTLRSPRAILSRDGRPFEAEFRRDSDWIEIRSGGRSARCGVAITSRGVWVEHEGRTYFLERAHREVATSGGARSADEIRAPMTGRVVRVSARAGAEAKEGELLLTIEAMKMEFKLTAPENGTVAEVLCAEGDRVALGQLLVRLKPTGGA
jgi:acetyl/propionyl-CoA carboxylase alpha subunit